MRRRPVEPPHLSTTEKHLPIVDGPRRKGLVPSQTTLSVQNIPDYSTPAGSAMANEEFRRLRLAVKAVEDQIVPPVAGSTTTAAPMIPVVEPVVPPAPINNITNVINNMVAIPETMESGFIYVNRLPLNPLTRPNNDLATNDYKYDNYNYTPENGYYGWYVYNVIKYKLKLPDPRAYILNLIDLHDVHVLSNWEELKIQAIRDYINNNVPSWVDKTDPEVIQKLVRDWYSAFWSPARGFERQEGYPEDEPIVHQEEVGGPTENAIIVRAVYKPDLDIFMGQRRAQELHYIDYQRRIVRTNLIYYYTLHRKV